MISDILIGIGLGIGVAWVCAEHRRPKREPPSGDDWESIEGSLRAVSVLFGPEIIYQVTPKGIAIRCRCCRRFNRLGNGLKNARCSACKTPIMIEQKAQA